MHLRQGKKMTLILSKFVAVQVIEYGVSKNFKSDFLIR